MKASKLIELLQHTIDHHGDRDVYLRAPKGKRAEPELVKHYADGGYGFSIGAAYEFVAEADRQAAQANYESQRSEYASGQFMGQ